MYTRYLRLFLVLLSAICFSFAFHGFSASLNPVLAHEALGSQTAGPGDVVINEFVVKGRDEWVELYNKTDGTIVLDGWYVTDSGCNAAITNTLRSGDEITAGGYFFIDEDALGDNFDLDNGGDVVILCDEDQELDRVAYGNRGRAPLAYGAIARTPNGADTGDDAYDWNVAPDPTKGKENNAAGVALGTTLVINEIEGGSGEAYKYPRIELYNPTSSTITVKDWLHSDGDITLKPITTEIAMIAPGEFFVFKSNTPSILDQDMVYLFKPDGTRVDQVAGENIEAGSTLQRIPDGAGPHDGYDWISSGGGVSWLKLPTTLGESNARRLAVSKSGPSTAVSPDDKVMFTLTYGNPLSETAHGVVITDVLPPGVSYAGFAPHTAALTLTQTAPPVWELGTIPSHTTGITFTVWTTFTGPFNVSPLENVVWINSATAGFVPVSATHPVEILLSNPDLAITKAVTPTTDVADIVTYTIVLSNSGQGIARGVIMTDPLTSCVNFGGWVTVDRDQDSVTMPPPDIKWGPWDIPGDTAYTIAFTATVADDSACINASVTNTAYFASANAGADAAQAVFTVAEPPVNRIFLPLVLRE